MKKSLKKLLTVVLSVSMLFTMGTTAFAADDTAAEKSATTKIESTLGMFTPVDDTIKVTIDKEKGTADVTFTTKAVQRQYTKIALVEQTKSNAAKTKAAVKGDVKKEADGSYTSTFTLTISVSKLGEKIPFSLYQKFTKSDGTKVDQWYNMENQHYLTVGFSPSVVTELTSAIYYQERTAGTDALCAAAKKGWDALSDAEKKEVTGFGYYKDEEEEKGGYEYFAEDTGDASLDNPGNADKIGSYELLVASFGTSYNDSRVQTIGAIEKALTKASSKYAVRRGFTSQIIINHIQARDSEFIDNMDQAVQRAIKNNVKVLVVQPTTLMNGAEYDELKATVNKYKSSFRQIVFSEPLCATTEDKTTVAKSVYGASAVDAGFKDAEAAAASKDTAFVFMGHGTSHQAKVLYNDMQKIVNNLGYQNAFIGTVEGNPEDTSCEAVIEKAKAAGYKNIVLRPLMVVAGDHANNDMAGNDDDSWKSQFEKAGFKVTSQVKGLGELEAVQQLYVAKAKAAIAKVVTVKATSISKLAAGTKKVTVTIKKQSSVAGYQVRYATSKKMTKAVTKTYTGASKTKKIIKSLKTGKTYYFQVRTYKKTDDGKAYSAWSKAKSVKVK